jgi:hypothetical protein
MNVSGAGFDGAVEKRGGHPYHDRDENDKPKSQEGRIRGAHP